MEILGKVHLVMDTQEVSESFKKRTLVVATEEQYVQYVPIDFVQDKVSLLYGYKVGESVSVSANVRGKEYNSKYYVSLQGWKIKRESQAPIIPPVQEESKASIPEPETDLQF